MICAFQVMVMRQYRLAMGYKMGLCAIDIHQRRNWGMAVTTSLSHHGMKLKGIPDAKQNGEWISRWVYAVGVDIGCECRRFCNNMECAR